MNSRLISLSLFTLSAYAFAMDSVPPHIVTPFDIKSGAITPQGRMDGWSFVLNTKEIDPIYLGSFKAYIKNRRRQGIPFLIALVETQGISCSGTQAPIFYHAYDGTSLYGRDLKRSDCNPVNNGRILSVQYAFYDLNDRQFRPLDMNNDEDTALLRQYIEATQDLEKDLRSFYYNLGTWYRFRNIFSAVEYFDRGVREDNDASFVLCDIGWQLHNLEHKEPAYDSFLRSAVHQFPEAYTALGKIFFKQDDFDMAADMFAQAMIKGSTVGVNNLAYCYGYGLGRKKDEERARVLYALCAQRGFQLAQSSLNRMNAGGKGN